jgi:hypothetical protein
MDRLVLIEISTKEIKPESGWFINFVAILKKLPRLGAEVLALFFVPPKLIKRESLEVPPDSIDSAISDNTSWHADRVYTQQRIIGWIS